MQRPYYPWSLRDLLTARPSVGSWLDLSDENYALMRRLAPALAAMRGEHCSCVDHHVDLHLTILEQTPYTTLFHLTHHFIHDAQQQPDPNAVLRAYHDARQLEVVELCQALWPTRPVLDKESLQRKWRINMFLSKWLGYCCRQRYLFDGERVDIDAGVA